MLSAARRAGMLGGKKESTETVKSENAMEMQMQKRDGDRDIDAGRGQSQEQRDRLVTRGTLLGSARGYNGSMHGAGTARPP